MRGLRHGLHSLGCLAQPLLLVLMELVDQRLEIVRGDYLLGVLVVEMPPLYVGLLEFIVRVVVDVWEAQGLWAAIIVVD